MLPVQTVKKCHHITSLTVRLSPDRRAVLLDTTDQILQVVGLLYIFELERRYFENWITLDD